MSDARAPELELELPRSPSSSSSSAPLFDPLTLSGHEGGVEGAVFSPDERLIASWSSDGGVCLWEPSSGRLVQRLSGEEHCCSGVFSPDSKLFLAGSTMWDLDTNDRLYTLEHNPDCSLFTPDGEQLFTAADCTIHVIHPRTGDLLHSLDGHKEPVTQLTLFPDASHVVSASADCTIRVWSISSLETVVTITEHSDSVVAVAVSPNSAVLASASASSMRLFASDTGEQLHVLDTPATAVAFSPSSSFLAAASASSVYLLEPNTGESLHILNTPDTVTSIAFSDDGSRLAAGCASGEVAFWDTCDLLYQHQGPIAPVRGLTFAPDGRRILVWADKLVRVFDPARGQCLRVIDLPAGEARSVAVVNSRIIARSRGDGVTSFDPTNGECEQHIAARSDVAALSPDGGFMAVACTDSAIINVLDLTSGRVVHQLRGHVDGVFALAFSPCSTRFVSGSNDHTTRVWSTQTGACEHVLDGHEDRVTCVAYASDLIATGAGSCIRLYSPDSGECLHVLAMSTGSVSSIIFSSSGEQLACRSSASVRLYDASTGLVSHTLDRPNAFIEYSPDGTRLATYRDGVDVWHTSSGELVCSVPDIAPHCVAFSPSGDRLACDDSNAVRLYSLDDDDASCTRLLLGHEPDHIITSIAFSPDGLWLTSASEDRTVRVWDLYAAPTFPELLLSVSSESRLREVVQHFPTAVVLRDAETDETILHVLARKGDDELLKMLLDKGMPPANPLQPGPTGSPLRIAAAERNDACVRTLLRAVVQRCNSGDHWANHSEEFAAALPLLARDYPRDLVQGLEDMRLPSGPLQERFATKECSNVKGMHLNDTFRTHSSSRFGTKLWLRYFSDGRDVEQENMFVRIKRMLGLFPARSVGAIGTDVIARIVPFEGLAGPEHARTPHKEHPIGALLEQDLVDALAAPVIRHVLDFKWNRYARDVFVRGMRVYLLMVALYAAASVQPECYSLDHWWSFVRLLNDLAVVALALYHVGVEARQLRKDGAYHYFTSPWNILDAGGLVILLALVPYRIFCWEDASILQSVVAVCLWLKLLDYFRPFRTTGPFVRMIFRIAHAIGFFIMVLVVMMLAFSHGFYLLFRDVEAVQATEAGGAFDYGSWWVLLKVYQVLTGSGFDRTELALSRSETLAVMLAVGFSVIVTVLMLNLLIALMGSVYSEVEQNVENEWLLERAQIVLDIDQYMADEDLVREEWFPRWVHVLQAKYFEEESSDITNIQARDDLAVKVDQVNARVERVEEQLEQVLELLRNKLD